MANKACTVYFHRNHSSCFQHCSLPPKTNCTTYVVFNSFLWFEHFSSIAWATCERCIHKTESRHPCGSDGSFVRYIVVWRVFFEIQTETTRQLDSVENDFIFLLRDSLLVFEDWYYRLLIINLFVNRKVAEHITLLSPNSVSPGHKYNWKIIRNRSCTQTIYKNLVWW